MKKKYNNTNKSLKVIIIVLCCVVLSALYSMYKMNERPKKIIVSLRHEKAIVLKDLEKTIKLLNVIKTDNKNLEEKLSQEKTKIAQWIQTIKTKKVSQNNLVEFKKNIDISDDRIKTLIDNIDQYKKKNDSISSVLKKEKRKNDTLKTSNKTLKKSNKKLLDKITEASSLNFYELQTKCYKVKNDKKETETNNANKTNLIKVSFVIAENQFIKPIEKNFYIQILDPKNNVVGNKQILNFGEDMLVFSSEIGVKYENQNTIVSTEIKVKNLDKGNYIVNVFDNSKKILQTKLVLD